MCQKIRPKQRNGDTGHNEAPRIRALADAKVELMVAVSRDWRTISCNRSDIGLWFAGFAPFRSQQKRASSAGVHQETDAR